MSAGPWSASAPATQTIPATSVISQPGRRPLPTSTSPSICTARNAPSNAGPTGAVPSLKSSTT